MKKDNYYFGVIFAVCAALSWGAMGPMAKLISAAGVSQITVICYRTLFIVAIVGAWLYRHRGIDVFRLPKSLLGAYFVIGVLAIVFNATGNMQSCVYLPIPQALILHYTFPLVTMAGEAFVTKERPTAMQIVSGLLVILGIYVGFILGKSAGAALSVIGIAWGLLSVFSFSAQNLLTRRIFQNTKSDPVVQLFYTHLFAGLVMIISKSIVSDWSDVQFITPKIFLIMQYPAVFGSLVGMGMMFASLKFIPASATSLILTLEIVVALMLTPVMLHQIPSLYEVAGCLIILGAVVCSILGKRTAPAKG